MSDEDVLVKMFTRKQCATLRGLLRKEIVPMRRNLNNGMNIRHSRNRLRELEDILDILKEADDG